MTTMETVHAASFESMESRKRKLNRVPLPYFIRPLKKQHVYDTYILYNDFIAYSSLENGFDSESDDEESSVVAVRTSLEKVTFSEIVSAGSLSDEEYVVVDNVEALPNPKTERARAVHIVSFFKLLVQLWLHKTKIHVAAEKKRLGLLETEKKKARAHVHQVSTFPTLSNQCEMERSKMRDTLEDKLQRGKRHRSEFLRQGRRQRDSISLYCDMMQQDGDLLSRKLSRCWRCFVDQKKN